MNPRDLKLGQREPKTLTLTLEETAVRVAEESDYLLARAQDGWGLIKPTVLGWDSLGRVWDEWEDAASFALGVRVVARDETAELRAENARLKADLREYVEDGFLQGAHRQEDGGYSTGGISTYRDLGDWLVEHVGWTRREGGVGRMQVYDPPRRLAGGEGQE